MAKKKLRDLSRQEVTAVDFEQALSALEAPNVPDMIAAVLAASLVEYWLEEVLKLHFRRSDDSSWGRMTDGSGPLRDFHSKITLGHALRSFNDDMRTNLNIVRDIRNAFAHSRTLLSFDHESIDAALAKAKPVRKGKRLLRVGTLALGASKRAYLELCMSTLMYLQLKLHDSLRRKEKRLRDNIQARALLDKLVASLNEARQTKAR